MSPEFFQLVPFFHAVEVAKYSMGISSSSAGNEEEGVLKQLGRHPARTANLNLADEERGLSRRSSDDGRSGSVAMFE
jgi:hypothetical protein